MQKWWFILVTHACLSFKIYRFTMHSKTIFSILTTLRIIFDVIWRSWSVQNCYRHAFCLSIRRNAKPTFLSRRAAWAGCLSLHGWETHTSEACNLSWNGRLRADWLWTQLLYRYACNCSSSSIGSPVGISVPHHYALWVRDVYRQKSVGVGVYSRLHACLEWL